ncbi:MAG: hypothetical protein ACU0AZ_16900 [Paracoccaceae bacterium]|jgi:chromosome segregation ATPase
MSQIEELQARIVSAMERIGAGVENAAAVAAAAPPEPAAELTQALEEEKLANAQLEDRLKSLKERHAEELEQAQAGSAPGEDHSEALALKDAELGEAVLKLSEQAMQIEKLDGELQRLRESNKQLREANDALRQANQEGVGDPSLINKAMLTELEALRTTQAVDAAEVSAVMGKLDSLLNNARDLPTNDLPEGEEA